MNQLKIFNITRFVIRCLDCGERHELHMRGDLAEVAIVTPAGQDHGEISCYDVRFLRTSTGARVWIGPLLCPGEQFSVFGEILGGGSFAFAHLAMEGGGGEWWRSKPGPDGAHWAVKKNLERTSR